MEKSQKLPPGVINQSQILEDMEGVRPARVRPFRVKYLVEGEDFFKQGKSILWTPQAENKFRVHCGFNPKPVNEESEAEEAEEPIETVNYFEVGENAPEGEPEFLDDEPKPEEPTQELPPEGKPEAQDFIEAKVCQLAPNKKFIYVGINGIRQSVRVKPARQANYKGKTVKVKKTSEGGYELA